MSLSVSRNLSQLRTVTSPRNSKPLDQVFGLLPAMVLEPEIVGKLTLEAEPVMLGLNSLRLRIVIHIADGAQPRMPGGRYIGVTLRASQRVRDRYFQGAFGQVHWSGCTLAQIEHHNHQFIRVADRRHTDGRWKAANLAARRTCRWAAPRRPETESAPACLRSLPAPRGDRPGY